MNSLQGHILQDVRFSIRTLRKSPGFALTALLTLGLGIGSVTSVFSVVNSVLLKPFAFHDPERLVVLREGQRERNEPPGPDNYQHYLNWKTNSKVLTDAAIFRNRGYSVSTDSDHPDIVGGLEISPNFFRWSGFSPSWGGVFSSFGIAALLLAVLGVYGVLAYSVSLRQQEFGIRVALGSDKSALMQLVMRQAAIPVAGGILAGLALASVAMRWVGSLLYETKAGDPTVIIASTALLLVAAFLAALLPARRAASVDPMRALRTE